jgi:hypothetical protein
MISQFTLHESLALSETITKFVPFEIESTWTLPQFDPFFTVVKNIRDVVELTAVVETVTVPLESVACPILALDPSAICTVFPAEEILK